jgi:hypothetical protein
MIEYLIELTSYIIRARLIINELTYYFLLKKYSDNSGYGLEVYDVNDNLLHSEPIRNGEGILDPMNILKMKGVLLYTLDMNNDLLTILYMVD